MRIRLAVPLFAIAVALAGASLAQAMTYEIRTTGTVVSKTADALVVRIDDHGHHIRFDVDRSTILPDDVASGTHVERDVSPDRLDRPDGGQRGRRSAQRHDEHRLDEPSGERQREEREQLDSAARGGPGDSRLARAARPPPARGEA